MNAIGIIGGVGPAAGIDLFKKVLKHTNASKDQEHISLFLTSCPSLIPDRTEFLLKGGPDPAPGIQKCLEILASNGATAVGLGCNTAHSPKILGRVQIPQNVRFVNMIEETCKYASEKYVNGKIGLIATLGTINTGVYADYFKSFPNLELVVPSEETRKSVHDAIYNSKYGIKATAEVSAEATHAVVNAVCELRDQGCKAVILGCTELPIVFSDNKNTPSSVGLIDPTEVLAVSLIKAVEPDKLI